MALRLSHHFCLFLNQGRARPLRIALILSLDELLSRSVLLFVAYCAHYTLLSLLDVFIDAIVVFLHFLSVHHLVAALMTQIKALSLMR